MFYTSIEKMKTCFPSQVRSFRAQLIDTISMIKCWRVKLVNQSTKPYLFISLRYIHKANFYNNLPESLLPLRKEVTVYIKEFALVYGTKPSEVTILSKFLKKRPNEEEEIMHAIGKGFLSPGQACV